MIGNHASITGSTGRRDSVGATIVWGIPADFVSVVTVVGAGRGPLVDCTLRAMKRSGRRARVYAVEKNVSAYVT